MTKGIKKYVLLKLYEHYLIVRDLLINCNIKYDFMLLRNLSSRIWNILTAQPQLKKNSNVNDAITVKAAAHALKSESFCYIKAIRTFTNITGFLQMWIFVTLKDRVLLWGLSEYYFH